MRPRVIPALLVDGERLVKTVRFADPVYVGDPLNTVRIFNDKEVDELVVLDVGAARGGAPCPPRLLRDLAGECFMPLCFGGGIRTLDQIRELVHLGVEKVAVNTAAVDAPAIVEQAAGELGRQSVVVSIDARSTDDGRWTSFVSAGRRDTGIDPLELARRADALGAGEILLTAVDREGTMLGYATDLIARVSDAVSVPVIAHGGAGSVEDLRAGLAAGASAVAAGSLFVFYGPRRAVLVTYPEWEARAALAA